MTDIILSSFLSLFALFGNEDQVEEPRARALLVSYLRHHIGIRNVDSYLDLYSDMRVLDDEYSIYESSQKLYDAMNENERINFYWQIVSASLLEQLYIISQNSEKFLAAFDDEAAANLLMRIVLIQDAINRLTNYDPELLPVAEAIDPLVVINAMTVEELKIQVNEAKDQIAEARQAVIELEY